jgi:hypothetical protein
MAFSLQYVYDYVTKLSSQQAKVIPNYENKHVRSTVQGEAKHTNIKSSNLVTGKLTTAQVTKLLL